MAAHSSVDTVPTTIKHSQSINKKIKNKTREFPQGSTFDKTARRKKNLSKYNFKPPKLSTVNMRDNSENRSEKSQKQLVIKSPGTQLMNYTHKSKRLTTSTDNTLTSKASSKSKKRLNNSTSCNFLGINEKQTASHGDRKMSKYINAKNGNRYVEVANRTDEYPKSRRNNTSISNISVSHKVSASRPKSKKKKKPTHMKSHSNVPTMKDQKFYEKSHSKKQYSESKGKKKKKFVHHQHHQSVANMSTSITNKNNVLMIDSAIGTYNTRISISFLHPLTDCIGFKAFINL